MLGSDNTDPPQMGDALTRSDRDCDSNSEIKIIYQVQCAEEAVKLYCSLPQGREWYTSKQ